MKKVKRMMFGGISKGVASAAQKAAAAPKMKALGLGEGIARAAGVPVGTTVNAPASILPIGDRLNAAKNAGLGTATDTPSGPLTRLGDSQLSASAARAANAANLANAAKSQRMAKAINKLGGGSGKMEMGKPVGIANPNFKPGAGVTRFAPKMKKGGSVSSASKRADGIATKGKTKGKIV